MSSTDSDPLCFACGLCCNGVIFADGQLHAGDDVPQLRSLGLRIAGNQRSAGKNDKFLQPCHVFDGCRCRIYADRPQYCREFECLLLKNVTSGRTKRDAALRVIGTARQHAEDVRRLLRELGDDDEHVALSLRFRRMRQRLEASIPDRKTSGLFGELTLAVHDLNLLLSDAFYPGPGDRAG
jgi:hypothetical protein